MGLKGLSGSQKKLYYEWLRGKMAFGADLGFFDWRELRAFENYGIVPARFSHFKRQAKDFAKHGRIF